MKTKNAATATKKKKAMKAMKAKKAMKAMKAAPMKSGAMTDTGAYSAVADTRELVPKDLKDAIESHFGFKEVWCYNMLGQLHGMLPDDIQYAILRARERQRHRSDPFYVPMEL